jgi:hypothetical protein
MKKRERKKAKSWVEPKIKKIESNERQMLFACDKDPARCITGSS